MCVQRDARTGPDPPTDRYPSNEAVTVYSGHPYSDRERQQGLRDEPCTLER